MATAPQIGFASRTLQDLTIPHQVNVDARTGAASINVGVSLSPGRSGFQPSLMLAYSSGAGNSVYGLGWGLTGVPSVGLSTRKGLPRYDSTDHYAFGGAELVPWLEREALVRVIDGGDHWVHLYRGRVDGAFTRFEKWVHKRSRRVHWRVRDRNGTISVFGLDEANRSRIADPADEHRTFEWLLEWQYDRHGNAIHYEYAPEDGAGVAAGPSYERGRLRRGTFAQRYLRRIAYGNLAPLRPGDPDPGAGGWMFSVVFDYGERDGVSRPPYTTGAPWPARNDPFSSYRAGFEVRTYRLCRRILMFHHFPQELGEPPMLVGAFMLEHRDDPAGSTLERVGYTGYRGDPEPIGPSQRALPPLVFEYTRPEVDRSFIGAPRESLENVPYGIGGLTYQMIDLHGEGLPGILLESGQAWYYKPNRGGGHFGAQHRVLERPSMQPGSYAFSDFDGDGNLNLVVLQGREAGHYEFDRDEGRWTSFHAFAAAAHVRTFDASTQLLDLDGDGRADIVTVKQDRITWYRSKGKEGFEAPVELARPRSNGVSQAPTIGVNAALDYFFADMTGDGLPDQVRIQNGRAEYWPQLGNGCFGEGVVMEGAPVLDFDGAFDASRIRLVDLDGSGTSDLVYIGRGRIRYWINASGNRFVEGETISGLPYIDRLSSAAILDFLSDGTLCLVWSTALPGRAAGPLQYLRLTGGVRPRLLQAVSNSMGQETRITYGHSARHYLRDLRSRRGWTSKLPHHTTVVDRVEVVDQIGNTRFESLYEYHDGFFDGEERAFRGFGLVDRYDSDTYRGTSTVSEAEHTNPVCVRTWHHNGAAGWESRRARDHYAGDPEAAALPGPIIEQPGRLGHDELADAYRALAGQAIRTEVYGLGSDGQRAAHPYQVSQTSFSVQRLQPKQGEYAACFTVFASEILGYHYEQDPADPRVTHNLTLAVDEYGNVTRSCSVAYPRRAGRRVGIAAQERLHALVSTASFLNVDEVDRFEGQIPLETRTFEFAGLSAASVGARDAVFRLNDLAREVDQALAPDHVRRFDQPFTTGVQAHLVQWEQVYYWNDARTEVLPHGQAGRLPLAHHTETACFTSALLEQVFAHRGAAELVREQGNYRFHDEHWWQSTAVMHYLPAARFNLLERQVQSLRRDGAEIEAASTFAYDEPYLLTVRQATDALGNRVEASEIDYHLLVANRIVDPNENVSEVRYDALGVAILTSEHGRQLSSAGREERWGNEPLAAYVPRGGASFGEVLADPTRFLQQASSFVHYELNHWSPERQRPSRSVMLVRETHVHDGEGGSTTEGTIGIQVIYVDGFGRPLQVKDRVEPGAVDYVRDEHGRVVLEASGNVRAEERWRAMGHTVFNNKQQPARQYEPFFSPTHEFETDEELQTFGETTVMTYDPLGRAVGVLYPNLSRERTEFTAWEVRGHDANDTVIGSEYERLRAAYPADHPEAEALRAAQAHTNTPTRVHLDALGREVVEVADGGEYGTRRTETSFDFAGNPTQVIDARGLAAFIYRYDMQGRALYESSIDSGERWAIPDALGQALHLWDGRSVHQRIEYDEIGRQIAIRVDGALGLDHVTERMIYGDEPGIADAALRNLRGRLVRHHDQAGIFRVHRYDPTGNPLHTDRQLTADYKREPDWRDPGRVELEDEAPFESHGAYDALGRLARQELPDGTTRHFRYHLGDDVASVRVSTADGELHEVPFLSATVQNALRQRTEAVLGDGDRASAISIRYEYNRRSKRVERLFAQERIGNARGRTYQDIRYTYDPAGNLVHSVDLAQQPPSGAFYAGLRDGVDGVCRFKYDPFYQLREATGRVHRALDAHDYAGTGAGFVKGTRHVTLSNLQEVRRYRRRYRYDAAGNLQQMLHTTLGLGGPAREEHRQWHRDYWISGRSNRSLPATDLRGISIPRPESLFDENGNCLYLPHLQGFAWNYRNNLARGVIIDRSHEDRVDDTEYYVYGGDGMRVRKVLERMVHGDGLEIVEMIYLDDCEIKRVRNAARQLILERLTSHISDGNERLALLHQWTIDRYGRETDNLDEKRTHYQLSDHRGSASLEVDGHGNVISYEEYFPYGGAAFIASEDVVDVRLKDYRYSGKERDDSTGLYCYGHRYYAPWLTRWLSPDPIGPEDGLNLYQFVKNNPVNLVDPNGLQSTATAGEVIRVAEPMPIGLLTSEQLLQVEDYVRQHGHGQVLLTSEGTLIIGTAAEIRRQVATLVEQGETVRVYHASPFQELIDAERESFGRAMEAFHELMEDLGGGTPGPTEAEGAPPPTDPGAAEEEGTPQQGTPPSEARGGTPGGGDRGQANPPRQPSGEQRTGRRPGAAQARHAGQRAGQRGGQEGGTPGGVEEGVFGGRDGGVGGGTVGGGGTNPVLQDAGAGPARQGTNAGEVPAPEQVNSELGQAGDPAGAEGGRPEGRAEGPVGEHRSGSSRELTAVENVLTFFGGLLWSVLSGLWEMALMVSDLVALATESFLEWVTGEEFEDFQYQSGIGQLFQNSEDPWGDLARGLAETPDRMIAAVQRGDYFALGTEVGNIVQLAAAGYGLVRGAVCLATAAARRVSSIARAVRNLGRLTDDADEIADVSRAGGRSVGAAAADDPIFRSTIDQVSYFTGTMSQRAALARKILDMIPGGRRLFSGNVVVARWFEEVGGRLRARYAAFRNVRGGPHAERVMIDTLEKWGVSPDDVDAIYSELRPCGTIRHNCARSLLDRFPNAEITYSFDYGGGWALHNWRRFNLSTLWRRIFHGRGNPKLNTIIKRPKPAEVGPNHIRF